MTKKLRTQLVMDALSVKGLKKPVLYVITRWSSTSDMLKRLLELKSFIQEDLRLLTSVQITEAMQELEISIIFDEVLLKNKEFTKITSNRIIFEFM